MALINLKAEEIRERYKLDTVQGVKIGNEKSCLLLEERNLPKPKGGYSLAEACDLINKIESEEAGTPMERAIQRMHRMQLRHDVTAAQHERESKKVARLQDMANKREGAYDETKVDVITGKRDSEGNRIK